METIKWYSVELQLPEDGQKVTFKPVDNNANNSLDIHGIYIKSENMFFVGFEETGDFYFASRIAFWKNYDNQNK